MLIFFKPSYFARLAAKPNVVTVEVTRKGRLNLHKFDATLQAQLERYLVSLGILDRGQRLNVGEKPPAADIGEPVLQH